MKYFRISYHQLPSYCQAGTSVAAEAGRGSVGQCGIVLTLEGRPTAAGPPGTITPNGIELLCHQGKGHNEGEIKGVHVIYFHNLCNYHHAGWKQELQTFTTGVA